MSDIMKSREKGEELKHQMDQEFLFKVEARRNKLLGLWLAGEFGMDSAAADAYARTVIVADLEEPGIEDVIRKVMADIKEQGASIGEDRVRAKIKELDAVAYTAMREE